MMPSDRRSDKGLPTNLSSVSPGPLSRKPSLVPRSSPLTRERGFDRAYEETLQGSCFLFRKGRSRFPIEGND